MLVSQLSNRDCCLVSNFIEDLNHLTLSVDTECFEAAHTRGNDLCWIMDQLSIQASIHLMQVLTVEIQVPHLGRWL